MSDLILLNPKNVPAQKWRPPTSFAFLRGHSLLPAQASEAGILSSALPLALRRDASQPSGWKLVVVCSLETGLNRMIDERGQWMAKVMPDCARYLPFALKTLSPGKALAAIDARFGEDLVKEENQSVLLYDERGELHPAAKKRLDFLTKYQRNIDRTQHILSAFVQAGLITPWPESFIQRTGVQHKGLNTIDEQALQKLDGASYLELRKVGGIALAYTCLLSLYQVRGLVTVESAREGVTSLEGTGDLDLEFLNDSETIQFGPTK